jgi:hypothetical protein
MVPEGVLNLLVIHPLEGRMGEIVLSSQGIVDSTVRRNRQISMTCTCTNRFENCKDFLNTCLRVKKKNQLDATFCIIYLSSNSC